MIKQRMKIGPKGQVVIPKIFRDNTGIVPGSRVIMEMTKEGILIEKPKESAAEIFERIAKSGKHVKKIDYHGYEKELEKRWKKVK